MRARALAALLTMVLLVGCSKPETSVPEPPAPETPVVKTPKVTGALSEALFPVVDYGLMFDLHEEGKAPVPVSEVLLRDGDRVVAVQGRSTYATWHVRPDGVWRLDPKGGGAYLRYLPAELQDGLIWHQPSGKGEVWFRLSKCAAGDCWEVTVLNGTERTRLQFQPGLGVVFAAAENLADPYDPQANYTKQSGQKLGTSDLDRAALLKAATPGPGKKPPAISPGTPEEFTKAFFALLNEAGRPVTQADLDGNGKPNTIVGVLGRWTSEPLSIYAADGTLTGQVTAWHGGDRKTDVTQIPGYPRPVLLQWEHYKSEPTIITIWVHKDDYYGNRIEPLNGWAPKAVGTQASRVAIGEDGLITVEWEMGDPAGHIRISRYRLQSDPVMVTKLSTTYRPTGAALARPQTPQDVLQAAFTAKWIGLEDEMLRYFASPDAARALQDDKRITPPMYAPGHVALGTVIPKGAPGGCVAEVVPEEAKVPGSIGFQAIWSEYEWAGAVYGTVSFIPGPDGLPLIDHIDITGFASCGI